MIPLSSRPIPVSVLFIVRDEADRLPEALRSVEWADEVVVLDTGSTDGTPEIAARLGARVHSAPWQGFVRSRNRALGLAAHDWVLFLDADERVSPELHAEIERSLEAAPADAAGFVMPRLSWFLGRAIRHGTWYPDRILRLVRRSARARWEGGRVHERCRVDGRVNALAAPLVHHPYRDVGHALAKANLYARLKAEDRLEMGRRASLATLLLRPAWEFLRFYVLKAGALDGVPGLLAALLHAQSYFLTAAFSYRARPRAAAAPERKLLTRAPQVYRVRFSSD